MFSGIGFKFCVFVLASASIWNYSQAQDTQVELENGNSSQPSNPDYSKISTECRLSLSDPKIKDKIKKAEKEGAKLSQFVFSLHGYNRSDDPLSPLLLNHSYRPSQWTQVYNQHGLALLSLNFNYGILSLQLLLYGVEEMQVELMETEEGCFGTLTEHEKVFLIRDLMLRKFENKKGSQMTDGSYVCNQIIKDSDGHAEFTYKCCSDHNSCIPIIYNSWIEYIFILIAVCKIGFLFFGPLFFQGFIIKDSVRTVDYLVPLNQGHTIKVNKVTVEEEEEASNGPITKKVKQFKGFHELIKDQPKNEAKEIVFNTLHIQVDQKELMSEKSVPVGLLCFISTNIFQCGIKRHEPFKSCWGSSMVFGTLSPRNWQLVKCGRVLTWGNVLGVIGKLLLVFAIPIPYYIRVYVYNNYEAPEINNRLQVIQDFGLKPEIDHNLFQYISPSHGAIVFIYLLYVVCFFIIGTLKYMNEDRLEDFVLPPLRDMAHVSKQECMQLFLSHLVLPLRKFGLFLGLFFGLFYWTIMLPICLVVILAYCIPTVYLSGRFLIRRPITTPLTTKKKEENIRFFHLNLNEISEHPEDVDDYEGPSEQICGIMVGVVCLLWMLSVLLMYAECFGVLVEVGVCTLMGVIINAGAAVKFIMLAFWIITYIATCYNNVYNDYMKLSAQIFSLIKDHLGDQVSQLVKLRAHEQQNTAFRYFGESPPEELVDVDDVLQVFENPSKKDAPPHLKCAQLYWKLYDLIFFVGKDDIPRIPKEFFRRICKIEAPGCPGPEYRSLLRATKQLGYMVVFIAFVFMVVKAFDTRISSTNQFLVTMAGGFIPFVIRFVLKPKAANIYLNTYTFNGAIHEVIKDFNQIWPVSDVSLDVSRLSSGNTDNVKDQNDESEDSDDDARNLFLPFIAAGAGGAAVVSADKANRKQESPTTPKKSVSADKIDSVSQVSQEFAVHAESATTCEAGNPLSTKGIDDESVVLTMEDGSAHFKTRDSDSKNIVLQKILAERVVDISYGTGRRICRDAGTECKSGAVLKDTKPSKCIF